MKKLLIIWFLVAVAVVVGLFFLASKTIAPTISSSPTVSESGSVKTYTSEKLGIRFQYANSHEGSDIAIGVLEKGNRVYVSVGDSEAEKGQFVEVFSKNPDETFEASIRRQILADYPSKSCKIEVTPSNIQGGYQVAEITYPKPDNQDEPWFSKNELCNPQYDQTNGMRYFLYDPKYPDKFAYLDIGQYAILAYDQIPWQYTVEFID